MRTCGQYHQINIHRFKPFHLLTKSSSLARFGMIMINYGHLFSHASSTFLVGWQQTWSHENLRTRGNISGKGSTASFEIMLCDLDIQPSLLGTVRAPKYGYFVHRWTSQHGNFHGWRMVEGQFKSLDFWQPIFDKQKTMRVCIYMFFFVCVCVCHIYVTCWTSFQQITAYRLSTGDFSLKNWKSP